MARVKLSTEKNRNIFLYTSRIENLFISEFMPDAPGDYVKVFILGLMYAQYDEVMDSRKIAIVLGLSEDEVEEAWIYWASRGVIRRRVELSDDGLETESIEILSQIGNLYGRAPETEPAEEAAEEAAAGTPEEQSADRAGQEADIYESLDDMDYEDLSAERMTDKVLRDIYLKYQEVTGRTVSRQETGKIADAVKVYGIKPEIFDFAIDYCATSRSTASTISSRSRCAGPRRAVKRSPRRRPCSTDTAREIHITARSSKRWASTGLLHRPTGRSWTDGSTRWSTA